MKIKMIYSFSAIFYWDMFLYKLQNYETQVLENAP